MLKYPQVVDGGLLVLARAEDGIGTIGDGLRLVTPQEPEYAEWVAWMEERKALDKVLEGKETA